MNNSGNGQVVGGIFGTILSGIGTGLQTNELLQTISLCLTILGALLTIIMALVNWFRKAKKDGKIDEKELEEGISIIKDGVDEVKDALDNKENKE